MLLSEWAPAGCWLLSGRKRKSGCGCLLLSGWVDAACPRLALLLRSRPDGDI